MNSTIIDDLMHEYFPEIHAAEKEYGDCIVLHKIEVHRIKKALLATYGCGAGGILELRNDE